MAQGVGVGGNERQVRQLERQILKLQNQNQVLARDLTASKKREVELNQSVADLRLRLSLIHI